MDWYEIAAVVLGLGLALWTGWRAWKHIPKEIAEAFMAIADAIEDDKITREELKKIVEEFLDIIVK